MTDPAFKVEGRLQTVPFLARATFADYHFFGDASCAVLVEPRAAREMRAAAVRAIPHETGGLLSGRALCDDLGSYVVVSGFIEAPPNDGQPAAFEITAGELGELRTRAARANPGADEVGWWHTHLRLSSYSQTDRETQRMFERPDSVGLLVFASGTHWAEAHVGPDARDLGFPSVPQPGRHAEPGTAAGPAQRQAEPADARGRAGHPGDSGAPADPRPRDGLVIPGPPPMGGRRLSGQAALLVLLAVFVAPIVVMLITLFRVSSISGQFGRLQNSVSGQLSQLASHDNGNYEKLSSQVGSLAVAATPTQTAAPAPVVTATSVSWSCIRQGKGDWSCSVVSSPGTDKWTVEWLVNGTKLGTGRTDVPVGISKASSRVQAVLESPTGQQIAGPVQALSP